MTITAQSNTDESHASNRPGGGPGRNGLVGGVVALLLSFLPLSTVLGGGVAGYLQARNEEGTASAGAIAGAIGILPHVVIGSYLAISPTFVARGPDIALPSEVLIAGVLGVGILYAVGLGVLGALAGGYLRSRQLDG